VLQALGSGQAFEDAFTLLGIGLQTALNRFQALLDPLALVGIADMHELGADRAGVGVLQAIQQIGQFQFFRAEIGFDRKLCLQIGVGQAVMADVQIGCARLFHHRQRIEVGIQMAARTESGDQFADSGLFARHFLVAAARGVACRAGLGLNRGKYRGMRHITSTLEAVKISLPGNRNAGRINQIVFVEIFDECGIAAGKLRGLEELFDQTFHGIALLKVAWVGRPATRGLQTPNYNRVCPI